MRRETRRCASGLLLLGQLLLAGVLGAAGLPSAPLPPGLLGAWKARDSGDVVLIKPGEVVVSHAGQLSVKGFLGFGEGKLYLRAGLVEVWSVVRSDGTLRIAHGDTAAEYTPLDHGTPDLAIVPSALGAATAVSAERKGEIQSELRNRAKEDQAVRQPPFDLAKMAPVDRANTAYLRSLVAEVGWIDIGRFGLQAAGDAFLLLQHSGDLRLQLAALPYVEEDARREKDFSQATLLYDRTQVNLGHKQRYGSQLAIDAAGNPVVLPLEDAGKVDSLLKDLGLPPLHDYLDMAGKALFQGKAIHIASDDDLAAVKPGGGLGH